MHTDNDNGSHNYGEDDDRDVCLHSNSKQFLSRNHNNNIVYKKERREKKRQFLVVRFVLLLFVNYHHA